MACVVLETRFFTEEEIEKFRKYVNETEHSVNVKIHVAGDDTDTEMLRRECFAYYHFEENLSLWKSQIGRAHV